MGTGHGSTTSSTAPERAPTGPRPTPAPAWNHRHSAPRQTAKEIGSVMTSWLGDQPLGDIIGQGRQEGGETTEGPAETMEQKVNQRIKR